MQDLVFVERRSVYEYPSAKDSFSPSVAYPEYPWSKELASDENPVYDMVRNSFRGLGLDVKNFGSSIWNPLGSLVKPGDTVLLKPNMVLHENHGPGGHLCVITNPSVVRAVLDYVVIALKGTGKIVVGDAPLQSCDFERLIEENGYTRITRFFKERGIDVELKDFRLLRSRKENGYVSGVTAATGDPDGYCAVNLGFDSMHALSGRDFRKYRVTNYDPAKMAQHHNEIKHEYLVSRSILNADVVINLPKPKTHRKAGMTSALKNLIGINGHKDWLPHHTQGSVSEGGDEYLKTNVFKKLSVKCQEKVDVLASRGKDSVASAFIWVRRAFTGIWKITSRDKFSEGSWYGNDTIWRTTIDLNRILIYANKCGTMCPAPQRGLLVIGDLILSGEGEGPLEPNPKPVGIIAAAKDAVAFDAAIAALMGFDSKKIVTIREARTAAKYNLLGVHIDQVKISSNDSALHGRLVRDLSYADSLKYRPSRGWVGNIESK